MKKKNTAAAARRSAAATSSRCSVRQPMRRLGGPANLPDDAKPYELCRRQLFQYLSRYVMFFIGHGIGFRGGGAAEA